MASQAMQLSTSSSPLLTLTNSQRFFDHPQSPPPATLDPPLAPRYPPWPCPPSHHAPLPLLISHHVSPPPPSTSRLTITSPHTRNFDFISFSPSFRPPASTTPRRPSTAPWCRAAERPWSSTATARHGSAATAELGDGLSRDAEGDKEAQKTSHRPATAKACRLFLRPSSSRVRDLSGPILQGWPIPLQPRERDAPRQPLLPAYPQRDVSDGAVGVACMEDALRVASPTSLSGEALLFSYGKCPQCSSAFRLARLSPEAGANQTPLQPVGAAPARGTRRKAREHDGGEHIGGGGKDARLRVWSAVAPAPSPISAGDTGVWVGGLGGRPASVGVSSARPASAGQRLRARPLSAVSAGAQGGRHGGGWVKGDEEGWRTSDDESHSGAHNTVFHASGMVAVGLQAVKMEEQARYMYEDEGMEEGERREMEEAIGRLTADVATAERRREEEERSRLDVQAMLQVHRDPLILVECSQRERERER